jgi:glycosyltransferase involved in cell wall biosynthesis
VACRRRDDLLGGRAVIGGKTFSGFVITHNEQDDIGGCLESIKWVDEVVVVDSFSTDATVEIARRYTDRIVQHEFGGHVAQTRFAFEQTTCDWVIWLDADERLTREAAEEVHEVFGRPGGPGCDGFAFPRKTFFLGRWVTHGGWYPQRKLRLMRRGVARVGGEEPHPEAFVEGRVKNVRGDILHLSYPGGILEYVQRSARYADIAARGRLARGERASLVGLVLKPPFVFLKSYVLKLGLLDGVPGLAVAAGTAYHRFIRDIRMRELAQGEEGRTSRRSDAGRPL